MLTMKLASWFGKQKRKRSVYKTWWAHLCHFLIRAIVIVFFVALFADVIYGYFLWPAEIYQAFQLALITGFFVQVITVTAVATLLTIGNIVSLKLFYNKMIKRAILPVNLGKDKAFPPPDIS